MGGLEIYYIDIGNSLKQQYNKHKFLQKHVQDFLLFEFVSHKFTDKSMSFKGDY